MNTPGISGIIFDIKKYAIHDGPGIRTTVFLKGCPLRCVWCHNPESWVLQPQPMFRQTRCVKCGECVEICPEKAVTIIDEFPRTETAICSRCGTCMAGCPGQAREIAGKELTVGEVIQEVLKDVVFYDESGGGATFSGGEPMMQPVFLTALLAACKDHGIHTTVDTCCYAKQSDFGEILDHTDLFLCDLKHMDSDKHRQFTGVNNVKILDNLAFLAANGAEMIIRIPVVPGFNDTPEVITSIVNYVKSLKTVRQIDLLQYNSAGVSKAKRLGESIEMIQRERPDDATMEMLADCVRTAGFETTKGG